MILAIDVGNTYIKYKMWDGDRFLLAGRLLATEIDGLVGRLQGGRPDKVMLASVGASGVEQEIRSLFTESTFLSFKSASCCLGVKNGYEHPEKLGVDRWLAVIEAYHRSDKKPCAIFDLGTALTLDVVNGHGVHQGGYIAPGLAMMRQALLQSTEMVRYEPKNDFGLGYGLNTVDAVENGTFSVILAWLRTEMHVFKSAYPDGVVYLTGGLGKIILPFLHESVSYAEDLVLDALKRVASS